MISKKIYNMVPALIPTNSRTCPWKTLGEEYAIRDAHTNELIGLASFGADRLGGDTAYFNVTLTKFEWNYERAQLISNIDISQAFLEGFYLYKNWESVSDPVIRGLVAVNLLAWGDDPTGPLGIYGNLWNNYTPKPEKLSLVSDTTELRGGDKLLIKSDFYGECRGTLLEAAYAPGHKLQYVQTGFSYCTSNSGNTIYTLGIKVHISKADIKARESQTGQEFGTSQVYLITKE
jgi:hypothetical protein